MGNGNGQPRRCSRSCGLFFPEGLGHSYCSRNSPETGHYRKYVNRGEICSLPEDTRYTSRLEGFGVEEFLETLNVKKKVVA